MIEQTNQFLNVNGCFNCHTVMTLEDEWYCIQSMGDNNAEFCVNHFPNGKQKRIFFCPKCWNMCAGQKYTFVK